MEPHLVTAVIPAFNAERWIDAALDSVLAQTYRAIECIVVDDGSTDTTAEIVSRYPSVRYIHQANAGDAAARNAGASQAAGDYIAFLDADDLWLPRKVELQMERLAADPELGMVFSAIHLVDEQLDFIGRMPAADGDVALRNTLLFEKPYMTGIGSTSLVRKDVFFAVGGFDQRLRASADWAFACKVASMCKVASLTRPLALYRQHGLSQVHTNLVAVERDSRLIYKEAFGPGGFVPRALKKQRRRGWANLCLSLAAGWWRRGKRIKAASYVVRSLLLRPDRILLAFRRRMLPPP